MLSSPLVTEVLSCGALPTSHGTGASLQYLYAVSFVCFPRCNQLADDCQCVGCPLGWPSVMTIWRPLLGSVLPTCNLLFLAF